MHAQRQDHKELALPPGFTAVASATAWTTALRMAAADAAPGTLVYDVAGGVLEVGLILAPDRPVDDRTALRLGTLAVRDALVAQVNPETAVAIVAEALVTVNDGEVATIMLARGPASDDGVPDWLVLGCTIRVALQLEAPGLTPSVTDLAEEGVDVSGVDLLGSVCRHLLAAIDLWHDQGAPGIDRAWRSASTLQLV